MRRMLHKARPNGFVHIPVNHSIISTLQDIDSDFTLQLFCFLSKSSGAKYNTRSCDTSGLKEPDLADRIAALVLNSVNYTVF